MTKIGPRFAIGVILLLSVLCMPNVIRSSYFGLSSPLWLSDNPFTDSSSHSTSSKSRLDDLPALLVRRGENTIFPGELPGYTGWPRPAMTLAGSFRMLQPCGSTSGVSMNWTCSVHCSHEACRIGGSLFYVRAYGPAILPGIVTDHRNGTYDVTFLPLDRGTYTVEVVLTFSNPLPFSKFPMKSHTEPAYEGYMLPAFPVTVSVTDERPHTHTQTLTSDLEPEVSLPLCTLSELLESSPTSALETGRWVVAEKMIDRPFFSDNNHDVLDQNGNITLDGYRQGDNSLGFRMDYRPVHCSLLDQAAIRGAGILHACQNKSKIDFSNRYLHLVVVGDSNIVAQSNWAHNAGLFGDQFRFSLVHTQGGINAKLPNITRDLSRILSRAKQNVENYSVSFDFVVLFNSGLHDIIHLCGSEYFGLRINFTARGTARCIDTYRQRLRELARMMKEFPSALTVFQTTTAAWPKWGLVATAWPADKKQSLPFSSSFAEHFNGIAWEVMQEFDIPVMDTYWLTLSRPDHREVTAKNDIPEKMAHAGPQVYSVLVRKWAMMILGTICPSAP